MSQVTIYAAGVMTELQGVMTELQGSAIPFGCICSYTWATHRPGVVRNGALMSCPADHTEVDK